MPSMKEIHTSIYLCIAPESKQFVLSLKSVHASAPYLSVKLHKRLLLCLYRNLQRQLSTNMTSTILILGGTGTVGSRIARQLSARQVPILVASRNGTSSTSTSNNSNQGTPVVLFDWHRRETWANPFSAASSAAPIGAVYLIAPPTMDSDRVMTEFVDFARARGVRRFVLQSASSLEAGGPAMGKIHAYLSELGQRGEVDWAVLRPTWFQGMCTLCFGKS